MCFQERHRFDTNNGDYLFSIAILLRTVSVCTFLLTAQVNEFWNG